MKTDRPTIPTMLRAAGCLVAGLACANGAAAQTATSPAPLPAPAPVTTGTGSIIDANDPDIVLTVRGGVAVSPAYFGSDDYEVGPNVAARIDYLRFPNGFEFGSGRAVGFRTGWGLRGSVRYIGQRDSADHSEIDGLNDIDWAFEAGLGVGYEQRNYRVFTDLRYAFIGYNGWTGDIGADAIAYPVDGLTLTLGPRLQFGDNKFASTYFGVSDGEAANSDFQPYDATGGLLGAGVAFTARYLFNDRWGVEGGASWNRLLNDAGNSPITALGSDNVYEIRLGVTRSISLDF